MPETTEPLTESKPDIKTALRKLQDAAWSCGTDEYRDGVSDAACTRRYDAMIAARDECVSAADVLLTENTDLREQLADIISERDRWDKRARELGHLDNYNDGTI